MAISPQEAFQLDHDALLLCRVLGEEIDNKVRQIAPKSSRENVTLAFRERITGAVQEELRQRYAAVGWSVAISSACIILRPKDEDQVDEA